jgi:hypothetical protein
MSVFVSVWLCFDAQAEAQVCLSLSPCVCLFLLVSVFVSLCGCVSLARALSSGKGSRRDAGSDKGGDCWVLHLYHFVREAVGADVC